MKPIPMPKPGVSEYFNSIFAYLPGHVEGEKYNFRSIENIPDCAKYEYPHKVIDFRVPEEEDEMLVVTLRMDRALATLGNAQYHLHPNRWDRVKNELSEGWCYMPWMTVANGDATLMDGRHRIVTLMKIFGLECCPFMVEPEDLAIVEHYDKSVLSYQEYLQRIR